MLRIAAAAEQAGSVASAGAFYERAAGLNPASRAAAIGVARTLAQQGRTSEAIATLQQAHSASPGDKQVTATLGRLLIIAHQPEAALAIYASGLAQDRRSPALLIGSGVALDAMERHTEAQQAYRSALASQPDSVAARNNLALSLSMSGNAADSIALLQSLRGQADAADQATVEGNLALVYGLSGDEAQAAAAARQTLPDTDVAANLRFYAAMRDQGGVSGPSSGLAGAGARDGAAAAGAALPAVGAP